jgi:hypothetical protein
VPPEVNAANLRLGHNVYECLLGFRPIIALINEQAYSTGLLGHYQAAGYRAIIMEWDNPARFHPEWDRDWAYLPQFAVGQHGEELPLIWNSSIAFQKFQRFAHGEMELREYVAHLSKHVAATPRCLAVYGNDAEVFDFRPGRYATEPTLHASGEWSRIESFFAGELQDPRLQFIRPSQALELLCAPGAGNRLHLESAEDPIPVKKQEKYNLNRWAVTGRNNLGINSSCRRIYEALKNRGDDDSWRELCYLWSSDFRTHITEKRWLAYCKRLQSFEEKCTIPKTGSAPVRPPAKAAPGIPSGFDTRREGHFLSFVTERMKLVLNCRRGLAIDSLAVNEMSEKPLVGTLPHGYYQDIALAADFYTGHLVLEAPGRPKITDLVPVEPIIERANDKESVLVCGNIETQLGLVHKTLLVSPKGQVQIDYDLEWEQIPAGVLRLGHITLNPEAFDLHNLYYETCNGGFAPERFGVRNSRIDHGRPVSFLVSATAALGMTSGQLRLGDRKRVVTVQSAQEKATVTAQITFLPVRGSYFFRASFSAMELDDTCLQTVRTDFPRRFEFSIHATAEVPGRKRAVLAQAEPAAECTRAIAEGNRIGRPVLPGHHGVLHGIAERSAGVRSRPCSSFGPDDLANSPNVLRRSRPGIKPRLRQPGEIVID